MCPDEAGVHFRLGKVIKVVGEGFYFQFPVVDSIDVVVTSEQAVDLPNQTLTTKDMKSVNVSGTIVYEVIDPVKAILSVMDYDESLPTLAMQIIGQEIPRADFTPDLSLVSESVVDALEQQASKWGISITTFGFSDNVEAMPIRLYE